MPPSSCARTAEGTCGARTEGAHVHHAPHKEWDIFTVAEVLGHGDLEFAAIGLSATANGGGAVLRVDIENTARSARTVSASSCVTSSRPGPAAIDDEGPTLHSTPNARTRRRSRRHRGRTRFDSNGEKGQIVVCRDARTCLERASFVSSFLRSFARRQLSTHHALCSRTTPRAAARRVETDDPTTSVPSSTPELMVTRALEFADVTPEDVVYDLGCNDGRVRRRGARARRARGGGGD